MVHKLSEHCYCSDFDSNLDRPRLGYVHDEHEGILIDVGNSPAHLSAMLKELEDLGLPKPTRAILTHWHWDHVYGLHAFDGQSYATNATQAQLIKMTHWAWDDASMRARLKSGEDIKFCDTYIRKEYPQRSAIRIGPATHTFEKTLTLTLESLTLHALALDNDHAPDACVVWIPKEKILFLGDIYTEDYHHGPAHYTTVKLSSLIKHLDQLNFTLAIHGHDRFWHKDELIEELNRILLETC